MPPGAPRATDGVAPPDGVAPTPTCVAQAHAGNVLVRRVAAAAGAPAHSGWECVLSEAVELALMGAPSYAEQQQLAQPRLAAGATRPFAVGRDAVAFGHVLYEMATGAELTEAELSRVGGAQLPGPAFRGPPAVWPIVASLFLPAADAAKAPSLVDLIAEPFFSVELPSAAASASAAAPSWAGKAAALLKASRKRYGGDTLTVHPAPAADPPLQSAARGGAARL